MSRSYCKVCEKPGQACICRWVQVQANHPSILILQHPDESKRPLGTARLVALGLRNVHVHVGLSFEQRQLDSYLNDSGLSSPVLVYPKAKDKQHNHLVVETETQHSIATGLLKRYDCLILLDGTWRNTRELLLLNPWLNALPSMEVKHQVSSRYRIRQAKQDGALATIEAVSMVLSLVDSEHSSELLLRPFEKMIEFQIRKMGQAVYQKNYPDAL